MQSSQALSELLKKYKGTFAPIVKFDLNDPSVLILDLTGRNKALAEINLEDTAVFSEYIFGQMAKNNTPVAVGGYGEDRAIYSRSNHFQGDESRTIHLGIDIWAEAGSIIYSPLTGKVHSYQDNKGFGDYGPTVILEHVLEDKVFYTLYGHLSPDSLTDLKQGKEIFKGDYLGKIGNYPENGNWPPHLHFQIISDLQGHKGDFPGVAAPSSSKYFLQLCPDPNLILSITKLN